MNIKLKNTNDYLRNLQSLKKRCDSEFDYMHEQIRKYKDEAHSIMVNIDKISSKLFWNTLAILIYFILQTVAGSLFSSDNTFVKDFGILDYLAAYGIYGDYEVILYPILYPFWFIRDLIILVALTPIIHFLIKHLKIWIIALFLINWLLDIVNCPILNSNSVLFFSLGAYFSINKINLYDCFIKYWKPSWIVYIILAIAALITKDYDFNIYIRKVGMIIGIVFFFNLVAINIKNNKWHVSAFLCSASFFVFATHEPWLRFLRKSCLAIIKPEHEISMILLYFLPAIIIICVSLIGYRLLSKITPRFLATITGGR